METVSWCVHTRRAVGEAGGDEAEETESERVLVGIGSDMMFVDMIVTLVVVSSVLVEMRS
jgi:hypothetical protein